MITYTASLYFNSLPPEYAVAILNLDMWKPIQRIDVLRIFCDFFLKRIKRDIIDD